MQDCSKEVWSILYVFVEFFWFKHNYIAYLSLKGSDCIFKIQQQWQSGFSRVYSLEPEIIQIGQSSHKMYSNNILNCQDSTTILNACTKKSGNVSYAPSSSPNVSRLSRWKDGVEVSKRVHLPVSYLGKSREERAVRKYRLEPDNKLINLTVSNYAIRACVVNVL